MDVEAAAVSVKVAVRVRPLSSTEKIQGCRPCLKLSDRGVDAGVDRRFEFDYVFTSDTPQQNIYELTTVPLLNRVFDGYNATILAYGQTGSGKTYTVGTSFGGNGGDMNETAGIIPRAVHELFQRRSSLKRRCDVRVSFLEIHHEEIHDLLAPVGVEKSAPLIVREMIEGGLVVAGLTSHVVETAEEVERLLARGALCRATASTQMNAHSSRSHAVCTFSLEIGFEGQLDSNSEEESAVEKIGKLTLVDLAGSERAKRTGASGERLKEGISINRGLLALGNVISVLADMSGKDHTTAHVPYRDSKLTRILQESLGGSSHTLMLACVSPADSNLEETSNTLRYASRARAIRNAALRNEAPSAAANALAVAECAALRKEVQLLRLQLLHAKGAGLADASAAAKNDTQAQRLREVETLLRAEASASIAAQMRADRLRLAQEQLFAAAAARGVDLEELCGGPGVANPLLERAASDVASESVLEELARLRALVAAAQSPEGAAPRPGVDGEAASSEVASMELDYEALALEERCMDSLRAQFASAIERLQGEVEVLQRDREALGALAANGGKEDPELGRRLREQKKALDDKLRELDVKKKEHARAVQLKEKAEAEARSLKAEV
jgi:kinesin family protein 4/21/27